MKRKRHPFAALDDIGRWGIQGYKLTPEDLAVFAQHAEEGRQRSRQRQEEERNAAALAHAV